MKLPDLRYKEQKKRILEENEDIRLGNAFHACLEQIIDKSEGNLMLQQFLANENLRAGDKQKLKQLVETALNEQIFEPLFNPNAQIKTEIDIRFSPNHSLRPDRILIFEDKIEVYDFKTGNNKTEKHHQQVKQYMHYLNEIFEKPAFGYIAYIQKKELVTVGP
jgi:CRISPR/Cas system-associated exonuclease Cas4 (RecB family)